MKGNAIILANGLFKTDNAKTAHGLIRESKRFNILAIIDPECAGLDSGELLQMQSNGIMIYNNIEEIIHNLSEPVNYAIVGVATPGGIIPEPLKVDIIQCIQKHISIISGLHNYLSDNPAFQSEAQKYGVELIDIRKPKPTSELHFWSGEILNLKTPVLAVLGTDCALGKRTTTTLIRQAANQNGLKTEMIFTGQTGWLQGNQYGFILDSTLNDFVSGELEHAILKCNQETNPDLIILEGQSALFNPSGPCGSEFILSGVATEIILHHAPKRPYFTGWEKEKLKIPSLDKIIQMISLYGGKVIAITLNTSGCSAEDKIKFKSEIESEFNLPVFLPLEEGVNGIIPLIRTFLSENK